MAWTTEQLDLINAAHELEIAVHRGDGTLRPRTPIWVVSVNENVYVRTWYRRSTGWYGLILRTKRARIRVPGMEADVRAEEVGANPAELRAAIDGSYRNKYRDGSTARMVSDEAAATTLRLTADEATCS